MPSLTDIPEKLLQPGERTNFVNWLATTATDWPTRRDFTRFYFLATNEPLRPEDFTHLEATALKATPHA